MADLLLYGDTERSAALRHEIPIAILDPLLYVEFGGKRYIESSSLEGDRLAEACPDAELIDNGDLGFYELIESGVSRDQVSVELAVRMAREIGVKDAIVDFDFPVGLADRLRADGIQLTVDDEAVKLRRRVKTEAE